MDIKINPIILQPNKRNAYYIIESQKNRGREEMEDHEIIELYFKRNEKAIEETSNQYGKYCSKIAYNILGDYEDSKECVNDTFLGAWNAIPPQRPKSFKAFLGRIVRNIAMNKLDYHTAKKRSREFQIILEELDECIASNHDVEGCVDERQLTEALNRFLYSTDEESRTIFIRRYWYSESISDVAGFLRISESKVKSNLFRTRNRLKTYLRKEGYVI